MTNNDLQNIHIKLKIESWTRTPLKAKDEFRCSGRVGSLHRSCMYVLVDSWYTYSQLRSRKTQYNSQQHMILVLTKIGRQRQQPERNCLPFLSTWVHPGFFWWGSCFSILIFRVVLCRSLLVLFSFFLVPLCCLFLIRFTDCDYPFGIFKLFLPVSLQNVLKLIFCICLPAQYIIIITKLKGRYQI
jgi:hypothetical protein